MKAYFTFDRTVRLIIGVAITSFVVWLIGDLKNVLLPFCLACLLSFIIEPAVIYNQYSLTLKKRTPAVFITLGDGIILFGLIIYFFLPIVRAVTISPKEAAKAPQRAETLPPPGTGSLP